MAEHITKDQRRKQRTRYKLKKLANGRPRLTIHRTPRHIYAQVIDDASGKTLVTVSTVQKDIAKGLKYTGNAEAAAKVGAAVGEAAKKAKVTNVVFDRGAFRFHGRVKALADAARAAGLEF